MFQTFLTIILLVFIAVFRFCYNYFRSIILKNIFVLFLVVCYQAMISIVFFFAINFDYVLFVPLVDV